MQIFQVTGQNFKSVASFGEVALVKKFRLVITSAMIIIVFALFNDIGNAQELVLETEIERCNLGTKAPSKKLLWSANSISNSHIALLNRNCVEGLLNFFPDEAPQTAFLWGDPNLLSEFYPPDKFISILLAAMQLGSRSSFRNDSGSAAWLQNNYGGQNDLVEDELSSELVAFIQTAKYAFAAAGYPSELNPTTALYMPLNKQTSELFGAFCYEGNFCNNGEFDCFLEKPLFAKRTYTEDLLKFSESLSKCNLSTDLEVIALRILGILDGACSYPLQNIAYSSLGVVGANDCVSIYKKLIPLPVITDVDAVYIRYLIEDNQLSSP